MAWVSADYYRDVYRGAAVPEEEFPRLEAAAQRYLEQAVFGRVKMCIRDRASIGKFTTGANSGRGRLRRSPGFSSSPEKTGITCFLMHLVI